MAYRPSRRAFLRQSAATGVVSGLADLGFLAALRPVSAAEARPNPGAVQFTLEIEPLVRLIEETPRERLLGEVGQRVHGGLAYRELLAPLLLAGLRNIQPWPDVGFKFHGVLVVNAAHLASLASPAWRNRYLAASVFWLTGAGGKDNPLPARTRAALEG